MLNVPIRDPSQQTARRIGLYVAWISIAAFVALIALRGWVVWHVITNVAPCPACMGATAMQQDCVLLGLFLGCVAFAFLFRAYLLQVPFLLLSAILIIVAAIDTVVLLTLTQRLYIFDVLKFGKELGAISQFARIFLESGTGKIVGVLSIFGLVLIACLFAPRPRRLKEALVLALLGMISIAFGSWRPSTMSYIHYEVIQNVLAARKSRTRCRSLLLNRFRRTGKARTQAGNADLCRSNRRNRASQYFVRTDRIAVSMHHSALFGGARDLTPNIDAIAQRYTYIPNFYANGFTTDGGMIALITGRSPVPAVWSL